MILSMAQMGNDGCIWAVETQSGFAQCYVGNGLWQANVSRKMKAVSCASASQVWGVDAAGKACVLTPAPVQTAATPSADLFSIGGRAGPVWTAPSLGGIAFTGTDPAGKTTTLPFPGRAPLSIAATDPAQGGYPLWLTLLTAVPGTTAYFSNLFWDSRTGWTDSKGRFSSLSIALDNSVWGYNCQLYQDSQGQTPDLHRYQNGQWAPAVRSPTGKLMRSYTVMYRDDIWATDDVPYLYHWNGYSWTRQPNGSPTWICRGWDGTVYGVADVMRRNIPQQVFRFNGFNQWLPTQLTIANVGPMNIESRDSGVWWSAAGELKFWPGAVWTDMGGPALATISGAADETVWAVDLNNAILRYNGKTWDNMPGQGRQVSVGRSDLVWSIDPSGNAQRWTGSGWEPHGNPGSALTSIAALTDGAVAGTAPVQQSSGQGQSITRGRIFEWDGSKWAGPGGVADQIAGSSSDLVAGVSRGPNGNRGDLVLGQLVWTVKVENVRFSADSSFPPVLTLSWDPYPGAVDYDARINAPTGNYEATGPRTSISYMLQKGDEYRWTGGWVKALDANGNVLATGVPDNYYYTSPGGTTG